VKIRLRGTEQDCRETAGLSASVLPIQSVTMSHEPLFGLGSVR
jgi:hypothetical protein